MGDNWYKSSTSHIKILGTKHYEKNCKKVTSVARVYLYLFLFYFPNKMRPWRVSELGLLHTLYCMRKSHLPMFIVRCVSGQENIMQIKIPRNFQEKNYFPTIINKIFETNCFFQVRSEIDFQGKSFIYIFQEPFWQNFWQNFHFRRETEHQAIIP